MNVYNELNPFGELDGAIEDILAELNESPRDTVLSIGRPGDEDLDLRTNEFEGLRGNRGLDPMFLLTIAAHYSQYVEDSALSEKFGSSEDQEERAEFARMLRDRVIDLVYFEDSPEMADFDMLEAAMARIDECECWSLVNLAQIGLDNRHLETPPSPCYNLPRLILAVRAILKAAHHCENKRMQEATEAYLEELAWISERSLELPTFWAVEAACVALQRCVAHAHDLPKPDYDSIPTDDEGWRIHLAVEEGIGVQAQAH